MTDHKDAFRAYLRAFNEGDLDAFDDLVTADYVNHDPLHPDPVPGPDPVRQIQIERFADGRIAEHLRATGSGG